MGFSDFLRPLGRSVIWIGSAALACGASLARAEELPDGFGGGPAPGFATDDISEETYARIEADIEANVARLGLRSSSPEGTPAMAWPMAPSALGYFSYFGISNYVDQDLDAGQTLDYNCGARTYDAHRGIDYYTWPYGWLLMDKASVEVIAAAPGTIVSRADGNFDRRCACITDDPNLVIIEHEDGSRGWYLHFKNGSTTPKQVGDTVETGEYLGVIGSSGCSTGPHLHFELHDASESWPGATLDPQDGTCNSMNPNSLWIAERPYRLPTINHLSTNSAAPVFPACPTQENPNEKRLFQAGNAIRVYVFLADELTSTGKFVEVVRPDGSVFFSTTHTTDTDYGSSYWYWGWGATNDITGGPTGRWTWQVTFNGSTKKRAFWVGAVFADDFEDANLSAWSDSAP